MGGCRWRHGLYGSAAAFPHEDPPRLPLRLVHGFVRPPVLPALPAAHLSGVCRAREDSQAQTRYQTEAERAR